VPELIDTLNMALYPYNTAAARAEALARSANQVDTNPPAGEVQLFFDVLRSYWEPTPFEVNAAAGVMGTKVGHAYVGGFLHSGGALPWVNFNREIVALQLICRIVDYKLIEQKNHPICGPVSFMHDIARQNPVAYVNFVIGLAENRRGTIGNVTVKVRSKSKLLHKHANPGRMREADYIALASLRNADNILPYRGWWTNRVLEAVTLPSQVAKWMQDAGYQNVEDHSHLFWRLAGGLLKSDRNSFADSNMKPNLVKMQSALANGSTVIMYAAGNLAHTALRDHVRDPWLFTAFGGHFMLVRGVQISTTGAAFDLVTWGKDSKSNPVEIPWSNVARWYGGYICGNP
jgi:hypothetical protein